MSLVEDVGAVVKGFEQEIAQAASEQEIRATQAAALRQVNDLLKRQSSPDFHASEFTRTTPDYVDETGRMRRNNRILTVTGRMSVDSLNALVAHIAHTEYQVSRVVARNYNPRQRPLQEAFGIPIIGSASWGARQIMDLLSDVPLRAVLLDSNSDFAIYQLEVPESWQGRSIHELLPEERIKTLAWTRAGQGLVVSEAQNLEAGDLIYLHTSPEEIEALQRQLSFQQEGRA